MLQEELVDHLFEEMNFFAIENEYTDSDVIEVLVTLCMNAMQRMADREMDEEVIDSLANKIFEVFSEFGELYCGHPKRLRK